MDSRYMQLALENARMMRGQTDPNPAVGCVLVKDGRVVGIGSHLKAGVPTPKCMRSEWLEKKLPVAPLMSP